MTGQKVLWKLSGGDSAEELTRERRNNWNKAPALAALAMSESLAYVLVEQGLVDKDAVQDALEDAADAQRQERRRGGSAEHAVAARLIELIADALETIHPDRARGRT